MTFRTHVYRASNSMMTPAFSDSFWLDDARASSFVAWDSTDDLSCQNISVVQGS